MAFARCSKSMNYLEAQHFCDFASNMIHEYDYIFYVSPEGVNIEDNGVRETNLEYRNAINEEILKTLRINKIRETILLL